jgi:glyceraldehyde-3-phosphate dehydrogenase (NADP+)
MFWKGEWVDRDERIDVRDPQDGSRIESVPRASALDVSEAVAAAEAAFEKTRRLPAHRRMEILARASEGVARRHEELARGIAREGVKTIREARKEVTRASETLRISAEEARRVAGETIPFDQRAGSENRTGYFVREPMGVVAAITPFNDPLNLVAHKIGPALAAGNSIVVKPHPATPLSALRLAEVLEEAGALEGSLSVVTGLADAGEALVTDRRVRMISFTGGAKTGTEILKRAGLKKVSLELGSNSPVIVMPDADLAIAVERTVSGAFWAAGQNCLHVQRLFVHQNVYDEFNPYVDPRKPTGWATSRMRRPTWGRSSTRPRPSGSRAWWPRPSREGPRSSPAATGRGLFLPRPFSNAGTTALR